MSVGAEESFQNLWEARTVQIGTGAGRSPGFLRLPALTSGGGGIGGGGSDFPLYVEATLMDSVLVEAGLRHFANLTGMTPDEEPAYRARYFDHFDARDHLLLWCELRTRYAANYLNPDRWIIYIEDDAENRFEPLRIMPESPLYQHEIMARPLAFHAESSEPQVQFHQQSWMLCFPKTDRAGVPILSEAVRDFKLVFQLIDDRESKAEGAWGKEHGAWGRQ